MSILAIKKRLIKYVNYEGINKGLKLSHFYPKNVKRSGWSPHRWMKSILEGFDSEGEDQYLNNNQEEFDSRNWAKLMGEPLTLKYK